MQINCWKNKTCSLSASNADYLDCDECSEDFCNLQTKCCENEFDINTCNEFERVSLQISPNNYPEKLLGAHKTLMERL